MLRSPAHSLALVLACHARAGADDDVSTGDSTSTVTVGPDGGLYVTQLALLHALASETEAIGGLIKFDYLP